MQVTGTHSFAANPSIQKIGVNSGDSSKSKELENHRETDKKSASSKPQEALSADDKKAVLHLVKRDREVRAHEAAHKAAAGGLSTGGISFDYQRGPDGKLYAVGGEVSISMGKVAGNPQATLQKANQLRSAALAPAQPSAQDRAVAAAAVLMATQARSDISAEQRLEKESDNDKSPANEYSTVEQLGSDEDRQSTSIDLHA